MNEWKARNFVELFSVEGIDNNNDLANYETN